MTIEKRGNKYRISETRDGIRYRETVELDHYPTKKEAKRPLFCRFITRL